MKPHQRVLIVDDDASVREWLAAFMSSRGLGYAVRASARARRRSRSSAQPAPDLVTLDLALPGMDGLETLRALRAIAPRVPVIMLSGSADTRRSRRR